MTTANMPISSPDRQQVATSQVETTDNTWPSLYRVAGVAAIIAAVLFLSDIIVLGFGGTIPATASEWFTLLQNDRATGLLQLFFSDLVGLGLLIPVFGAFYAILRRTNAAYSMLATALAFIGLAIVFAANFNYSLLYLSDQYAAATTEVQRAQLLAAAESTLATGMWSTGYHMSNFLVEVALLMFSALMLQSGVFSRSLAYLGMAAHGLDTARALVMLLLIPFFDPDTALSIGVPLLTIGGTLQLLWYPLVGWRLFRLGRNTRTRPEVPADVRGEMTHDHR